MEPILLTRPGPDVPWGFRLQGGIDQGTPLTVQRTTPGSVAARSLVVGDDILRIGNIDATQLTYAAAMETIKSCGDRIEIYTTRTGVPQSQHEFSSNEISYVANDIVSNPIINNHNESLEGTEERRGNLHGYNDQDHAKAVYPRQDKAPVQQVPDAVLNMAARTSQDKRPWTYAPDIQSLQQQRRRIQRQNYEPAPGRERPAPVHYPRSLPTTRPSASHVQEATVDENSKEQGGFSAIYAGPEIPSKTFQLLQSYTSSPNESGITDLARAAQRRQRRREKLHYDNTFNNVIDAKANEPAFDESAYLAGKIPILGLKPQNVSTPYHTHARTEQNQEQEQEQNDEKPFDERAYLAGRIPLVRGGPIDPTLFDLPSQSSASDLQPEVVKGEERDDENKVPFDERAYLAGRILLVKGGVVDPTQFTAPERRVVKKYKEMNRPRLKQPFDEKAYLAGKLNILGETNDRTTRNGIPPLPPRSERIEEAKPSWYKSDDEMVSEDEYDEESFLKGKYPIVRRSVDRELPSRRVAGNVERSTHYGHARTSWQRENPDGDDGRGGTCSETEFDERAYLAGRWRKQITVEKEYSTDTETELPSKTFRILRRSVSSDRSTGDGTDWRSPNEGGFSGDEAGSDSEKPYDYYMYHGRNIPSKIFSRLKKTMDRKAAAEKSRIRPSDPIERLKEKSLENLGIDVDTAMERLEIGKHDPDSYMEMLKKSVEQNESNIRIEPEHETTDF